MFFLPHWIVLSDHGIVSRQCVLRWLVCLRHWIDSVCTVHCWYAMSHVVLVVILAHVSEPGDRHVFVLIGKCRTVRHLLGGQFLSQCGCQRPNRLSCGQLLHCRLHDADQLLCRNDQPVCQSDVSLGVCIVPCGFVLQWHGAICSNIVRSRNV